MVYGKSRKRRQLLRLLAHPVRVPRCRIQLVVTEIAGATAFAVIAAAAIGSAGILTSLGFRGL